MLIKAKALLVNWAVCTILSLTAVFKVPFIASPSNPSVQVLSSVKAALTQVCTSLIIILKLDFLAWLISLMDFLSSYTASLNSSTQSFMADTSLGFKPWLRERLDILAEVDLADDSVTLRAALARSLGLVWIVLEWIEREV